MKLGLKTKTIGIMVLIACYISFPFFKIKYFETLSSLQFIFHYLLIPILFIAAIGAVIIYKKRLRKLNKQTNSKLKIVLQDSFTTVLLTGIVSAIIVGMTVSTIVTTNAFCGQSKEIEIKAKVLGYSANTTKWGRLRHRIKFINSYDKTMTDIEVYRKYKIGEVFNKKMKIGKWGQLYSLE
jgi:hypothetical protein